MAHERTDISSHLRQNVSNESEDSATDEDRQEAIERGKQIVKQMIPLIEILELKNKTPDEIVKEILVDFRTLPPTIPADEKLRAKILLNLSRMQLLAVNIRTEAETLHPSDGQKYDLKKFNNGIVALGVQNFMSAATQFCEEEAAAGEVDILSIGSGDGTVEKSVIAEYEKRFGHQRDLRIRLVDPDPKYDGIVDFKTVEHLIEKNPRVVGNCVAFIIWPNPVNENCNIMMSPDIDYNSYDIEAVRKLQPKAALVVYECFGGSGSETFRTFMHDDSIDQAISHQEFGMCNWLARFHFRKRDDYGLNNYKIVEIARQKISHGDSFGTRMLRMVKLMRTNN